MLAREYFIQRKKKEKKRNIDPKYIPPLKTFLHNQFHTKFLGYRYMMVDHEKNREKKISLIQRKYKQEN